MLIAKMHSYCLLLAVLILTGCASMSPLEELASEGIVIPQPDGVYVASGTSTDEQYALRVALASAEYCCMKQSKRHVVLEMATNAEDGFVNEKTADAIDLAAKVTVVGGFFLPIAGDDLRGEKQVQIKYRCE